MRESVRLRMGRLKAGWDCVFVARHPIRKATYGEIDAAVGRVFRRADLAAADSGFARHAAKGK